MPVTFRSVLFLAIATLCSGITLADEVRELSFRDFYRMPIGPEGLQPSEKLLQLRGKTVHIIGYMVHEENPTRGIFLLAPQPVSLADVEDGPADDLPATVITAHMPDADAQQVLPYRAGLWELTGKLELGNAEENNGRVSYVRLVLDHLSPAKDHSLPANGQRPSVTQAITQQASVKPTL